MVSPHSRIDYKAIDETRAKQNTNEILRPCKQRELTRSEGVPVLLCARSPLATLVRAELLEEGRLL